MPLTRQCRMSGPGVLCWVVRNEGGDLPGVLGQRVSGLTAKGTCGENQHEMAAEVNARKAADGRRLLSSLLPK